MPEVKDKARAITKENQGRSFEVLCPALGPWPKGHVFSEFEFRRIHPAPISAPGEQVDPEQYWEDAIVRLMTAEGARPKAIAQTDKKPMATPLGPESDAPRKFVSPLAARIQRDVMEQQAALAGVK